jgi:2'-hydroxyisoflavone reductase
VEGAFQHHEEIRRVHGGRSEHGSRLVDSLWNIFPSGASARCREPTDHEVGIGRTRYRHATHFSLYCALDFVRLLILGGTVFLGRALTDAALASGHSVTHLNRGRSAPGDIRVESLQADRTGALEILAGRTWDAVIDTCGYLPQVVRISAHALRESVRRYLFVSSISVYADFATIGQDEDAPVAPPPDPLPDAMTWDHYGALKAACEAVVRDTFAERALIVRPGLIVGPHDGTDRFTYWPHRVALGGRVAAPARASFPVQFIDVRDLAQWMVSLLERDVSGVFNATSPAGAITMGDVLATSREASGSTAAFEWLDEAFLEAQGVKPWSDMPLFVPQTGDMQGFARVSVERALAQGLRFRPLAETVSATLEWSRMRAQDHAWKAGLSPDRERALLAAWDAR